MQRCRMCPGDHRQVCGDGPAGARVCLIAEGPGYNEDKHGIPFVGRSGQELDGTYLRLAGLDRADVYVTNTVQCRQERNGIDVKPNTELVQCCADAHLRAEIHAVRPEIVVLCGSVACSLVGGIDLELEHGFPRSGELYGQRCQMIPMYHPAAGLHDTRLMAPMLEDWERLGRWMRGEWAPPAEPETTRDYAGVVTERELGGYLDRNGGPVAADTETDGGRPYSIQVSVDPNSARFILAHRRSLVRLIARHALRRGLILHNAPFDVEQFERAGGTVGELRDTQQELYALGLPQGLKQAVYRIFGYRMTSYDEVVTPHSKRRLEGWLAEALAHVSVEMRKEVRVQLKTKVRVDSKPHEAEAVLRRVLSHMSGDYDPWQEPRFERGVEKQRLLGREWLPDVEAAVGRMPRRSIVHAPMAEQIAYACGDAAWTYRLAQWLQRERERIVGAEWKVA